MNVTVSSFGVSHNAGTPTQGEVLATETKCVAQYDYVLLCMYMNRYI